ncbi:hypothetical protein EVAR_98378_1 [Eumeta japonica]|uniref:Uncharacterized protein n=1 Tax=Eumeta variegata TaxID=151549 RepID=A0A4C1XU16_EUMVA|nr:hypothetical protein EVAR_98378_1 [Eumeta japonica]
MLSPLAFIRWQRFQICERERVEDNSLGVFAYVSSILLHIALWESRLFEDKANEEGGPNPSSPPTTNIIPSLRYVIPSQEFGDGPVTPQESRVSVGGVGHPSSDGSLPRSPLAQPRNC